MTDNGNQPRPARTLTVKNFSVIKEAKLEFGKITVLIGPQSSGKSLLCKLAYFFSQFTPEFANNIARRHPSFLELSDAIRDRFVEWFPQSAWGDGRAEISYTDGSYSPSVSIAGPESAPLLRFDPRFSSDFERWKEADRIGVDPAQERELPRGPYHSAGSIYVPSGRSFFSTPNRGFVSASEKNLDWITQRFSTELDWDYKALISAGNVRITALGEFGVQAAEILGGKVVKEGSVLLFIPENSSRKLQFQLLSSGTLELLPLLNPLSQRVSDSTINDSLGTNILPTYPNGIVFVEEPELGVFPKTQNQLVRLFAWSANTFRNGPSLTITTHSPYILTAFNDLIKAGLIAEEQPDKASEVEKIIPRHYWIRPGDFAAYAFDGKDGILRPIMDEETKMINGDILDDISSDIADQFGQLLEIQYGGR